MVESVDAIDVALERLRSGQYDYVVSESSDFLPLERGGAIHKAFVVLDTIAEGVFVINRGGHILWANRKFQSFSADVVEQVRRICAEACGDVADGEAEHRGAPRTRRLSLPVANDRYYEVNVTPIVDDAGSVQQLAAVVWDSTRARRLQQKIDAIDNAGRELARIDVDTIRNLDVHDRLRLLEEKIIRYTRDLLDFGNFAIRVLDKKTHKLELIWAAGLPMEAQQLDLYASTEGNGISGYVAATGRSYICPDVQSDPRYLRGIDFARSSLTVPLRLHDQIVGVFNVESDRPGAFTEDDRQFAEIFGRHVAMAMNILDLLAFERHQTTDELASNVTGEIAGPLNDILTDATTLREDYIGHDDLRHRLNAIADNVVRIKEAIKQVTMPPCGLLGARDATVATDPVLDGKTVLIADDEEVIRDTIRDVLAKAGCMVETARDGEEACAMVSQREYDLILSDIKMPGRNGYEVFATAKDRHPQCPVIFMTGFGYDPNHSIIRARQEGLAAVLFKPFKVDQLLDEVRAAVTRC